MPGAYENRYDESIQNALENMNRQNTAGTGFDGSNVDYRGALSRLFGNAGAGADAAAQTANQLSGGYGASWAQSAADQSAASRAQAGAPGALAKARADALTQWQQELAGPEQPAGQPAGAGSTGAGRIRRQCGQCTGLAQLPVRAHGAGEDGEERPAEQRLERCADGGRKSADRIPAVSGL